MKDLSKVQKDYNKISLRSARHFFIKSQKEGIKKYFVIQGKKNPRRYYGILKTCPICKEKYFVSNGKVKRQTKKNGKYGTHRCFKKANGLWNESRYISVYVPNHPFCNYILEHRLVMEKHLERYLKEKEEVHHINGVRDDNKIKNLILFKNHTEYMKFHKISKQSNLIINSLRF